MATTTQYSASLSTSGVTRDINIAIDTIGSARGGSGVAPDSNGTSPDTNRVIVTPDEFSNGDKHFTDEMAAPEGTYNASVSALGVGAGSALAREHVGDLSEKGMAFKRFGLRHRALHEAEVDHDVIAHLRRIVRHQHQIGPFLMAHRGAARAVGVDFFDTHRDSQAHLSRLCLPKGRETVCSPA